MRKSEATRKRFIKLRAQGYTFRAIQKEINVSRPTLIKWSRWFEKQIDREYRKLERARDKEWRDKINREWDQKEAYIRKLLKG